MKKLLFFLTILLLPVSVQAETIHSFVSDITLSSDGSFAVTETIVYDFEELDRHGIFRTIPTTHWQESEKPFSDRLIKIDVQSVELDGSSVPYDLSGGNDELSIKIGDPERTISGEHTYVIDYVVRGGLSYYDSSKIDFYWNVTGDKWEVPIKSASAKIHDPEQLALDSASCYVGKQGESEECTVENAGSMVLFGEVALLPGEELTIAQALDGALVEKQVIESLVLWPVWLLGAFLWLVGLFWYLYRHYVEHHIESPVIAQYEPYKNFKPMYTGLLFDGRIDSRDITAGIVYLAEQGFLKIKHTGQKKFIFFEVDDYEIILKRKYEELETEFQRKIFTLLFDKDAEIGSSLLLSKLAKDTSKQKENYKLLNSLKSIARSDLVGQGFFEYTWDKLARVMITLVVVLALGLSLNAYVGASLELPLAVSFFVFIVTLVSLSAVYHRRTRKGYQALNYLKGFKEFLSVTDKERFKFHNAPSKSPEQFMAYLPYAIAFGVEKEWANVFKDITIPDPDWYEGQGTAFSAVYLSQSLGTFGSALTNASGTAPASSGGGVAGGGVGGGGGGSW